MIENKKANVFVYGTLKEGYGNHGCLENSPRITEGWLCGFEMWQNGIPYVRRSNDPESKVYGEVYEANWDTVLGSLDILEGHPRFYEREFISDQLGGVWVYLCKSGSQFVKSGVWDHNRFY